MDTKDVALACEQWAAATAAFNSYEHAPRELLEALPLVVSEVKGDRVVEAAAAQGMGQLAYQQTYMRVWSVELLLLVQPGNTPEETWTATQTLSVAVDKLGAALRGPDKTLGGRVDVASPLYEASYDPPEVEYADGTVARAATFRMNVGELTGGS